MRKWLALGVQVPFFAMLCVAACGGDDNNTVDGGDSGLVDVKADKKPIESGPQPDTSVTCSPTDVNAADLTFPPPRPINPTACSDKQIADYYTACLPGSGSSCSTFEGATSNQACVKCLNSNITDSSYGPLIAVPNNAVYINLGGCIALVTGDSSATGCGAKEWEASECEDKACSDNCQGADFTTYQKCTSAAASGTCANEVKAVCDLSDAGNVTAACALDGQGFTDYYPAVAAVFCGGYPADAGVPDAGSDGGSDAASDASDGSTDAPDDGG